MTERRSAARLVVLIVAGLAVAGTSPSTPPPAPTQPLRSEGSLRVSAEHPVAIQPLVFVVEHGQLSSLSITPTIGDPPADGAIMVSVVRTDDGGRARPDPVMAAPSGPPTSTWSVSCGANPCAGRFALVLTWLHAPAGGEADVAWTVDATATYTGSVPAGATPGRVTLSAANDDAKQASAALSRETSGKAVRLTEADRQRSWTVTLRREATPPPEPGVIELVQARLAPSVRQTAGPAIAIGPDGAAEDSRARNRPDPPVRLRLSTPDGRTTTIWTTDRPIEFEPFTNCIPGEPCETILTIDLVWADGRPDTAFDAAWTLDLASSSTLATAASIEGSVEPIPPPHLASATASGTFDEPGPFYQPAVRFSVDGPRFPNLGEQEGRNVAARATATVTATSVGAVPLPADAVISIYANSEAGSLGTNVLLHPGETATFAFEPRGYCPPGAARPCSASGSLGATILQPNRNQVATDGMVVRIEWSIETSLETVEGGTAVLTLEPQPTRRP